MPPKPVYQTRATMYGVTGDCFECCIATMLGITRDEMPSIMAGIAEGEVLSADASAAMTGYLFSKHDAAYFEMGLAVPLQAILAAMARDRPGCAYVLLGQTDSGHHHAVLCRDDKLLHDPAARWAETLVITKPCADGHFRIGYLVYACSFIPSRS